MNYHYKELNTDALSQNCRDYNSKALTDTTGYYKVYKPTDTYNIIKVINLITNTCKTI